MKAVISFLLVILTGNISWYSKGIYKDGSPFLGDKMTTACFREYRYRTFKITYKDKSIQVYCNDTGDFKKLGRVLDLSKFAFSKLAPSKQGIIRGAKIEILN